jgi:hypothetical protein
LIEGIGNAEREGDPNHRIHAYEASVFEALHGANAHVGTPRDRRLREAEGETERSRS